MVSNPAKILKIVLKNNRFPQRRSIQFWRVMWSTILAEKTEFFAASNTPTAAFSLGLQKHFQPKYNKIPFHLGFD